MDMNKTFLASLSCMALIIGTSLLIIGLARGNEVNENRTGVSEIVLRIPVYVIIFGQPLSFIEFVGLLVGVIAAITGTIFGLIEYSIWRRKRLIPVLTRAKVKSEKSDTARENWVYPTALMTLYYRRLRTKPSYEGREQYKLGS